MTIYLLYMEDVERGLDIAPNRLVAVCAEFNIAVKRAEERGLPEGAIWSLRPDGDAYYDRFSIIVGKVDFGQEPPVPKEEEEPVYIDFMDARFKAIQALQEGRMKIEDTGGPSLL